MTHTGALGLYQHAPLSWGAGVAALEFSGVLGVFSPKTQ